MKQPKNHWESLHPKTELAQYNDNIKNIKCTQCGTAPKVSYEPGVTRCACACRERFASDWDLREAYKRWAKQDPW